MAQIRKENAEKNLLKNVQKRRIYKDEKDKLQR
jgi:hypothetical protein